MSSSSLLSPPEKKALANAIQTAQYSPDLGDAANWRIAYNLVKIHDQWVKIVFDHFHCNGMDAMKYFQQHRHMIQTALQSAVFPEKLMLVDNHCWVEKSVLDGVKYQGPADITAKAIICDFFQQYDDVFYIPVDMGHIFDEPTLLNYSFNRKLTFDENWDEIRRIKKNENNCLFINDEWKKHIKPQIGWVTIKKLDISDPFVTAHYDYDQVHLQGLGVNLTDTASYWNFDFYGKPEMEQFFIEKYHLTVLD